MLFLLVVLATFLSWGVVKSVMPFRLPSGGHTALVLAMAYGWSLVPFQVLSVAAAASAVGVLHHLVGESDGGKPPMQMPHRKPTLEQVRRVPPLP